MAVAEGTWRHREACDEVKQSHEDSISVQCSRKMLDGFTPEGYLGRILNGGHFSHLSLRLYIESGWMREGYLFDSLLFADPLILFNVRDRVRESVVFLFELFVTLALIVARSGL